MKTLVSKLNTALYWSFFNPEFKSLSISHNADLRVVCRDSYLLKNEYPHPALWTHSHSSQTEKKRTCVIEGCLSFLLWLKQVSSVTCSCQAEGVNSPPLYRSWRMETCTHGWAALVFSKHWSTKMSDLLKNRTCGEQTDGAFVCFQVSGAQLRLTFTCLLVHLCLQMWNKHKHKTHAQSHTHRCLRLPPTYLDLANYIQGVCVCLRIQQCVWLSYLCHRQLLFVLPQVLKPTL